MSQESLLFSAAVVGRLAPLRRPADVGAPYDDYFRQLNQELRKNGPMRPCMLIDLDRLDFNLDVLRRSIRAPKRYRVVAKSLPSIALLDYIAKKTQTDRLMAFHQPFLNREAEAFPAADILLGKPMPVRAAETFYRDLKGGFDPARQLQWLLDTPQRLRQYIELAGALGTKLRVNIEIDVGLHRGGVADNDALGAILGLIAASPQRCEFAGFMGYDPHVVKLPKALGSRAQLFGKVLERYRGFVDYTRSTYPQLWRDDLTLNGAGSPTYRLYENDTLLNDISVGSVLLKPTDFELDLLSDHVPAAFIATPVLKASAGIRAPGMEKFPDVFSWWNPNRQQTFFIYGGHWLAKYASPRGLSSNPLFGYSSNQEMVNGSSQVGLGVDDHIFLRPTQSEAVLLQFGDLITVRGGRLQDRWPVLRE